MYMKKSRYIIIILALLLLISLGVLFYRSSYENFETHAELGMADESEEYIDPKLYDDFISEEEADYIKNLANDKFNESEVLGNNGKTDEVMKDIRDSKTAWLDRNDPIVKNIIKRVCSIHDYPVENAEDLQVVKYGKGGFYREHHDSVYADDETSKKFLKSGGHRVLTMIIYLTDDFEGGATRFVKLKKDVKPKKNGSILFYPLDKNNRRCHPKALHAGMPLKSGEKIIANVWIRQGTFVN
jgi:prolyl 4-hydroxylase